MASTVDLLMERTVTVYSSQSCWLNADELIVLTTILVSSEPCLTNRNSPEPDTLVSTKTPTNDQRAVPTQWRFVELPNPASDAAFIRSDFQFLPAVLIVSLVVQSFTTPHERKEEIHALVSGSVECLCSLRTKL